MTHEEIVHKTAETLLRASTVFSPDKVAAFRRAADREENPQARWVLESILENAAVAEKTRFPLCDDTGIPHVLLEVGDGAALPAGFLPAVREGVAVGLRALPGRPMGVRGNDRERISQCRGLYDDPGAVELAPVQIRELPNSDRVLLTVLMMGGGPEIRGKTLRVFHRHADEVVLDTMAEWATEGCGKLGCLPAILGFGIGRSNLEAAALSLQAMRDGDFSRQSDIERAVTERVNASGIGPLGLGGRTTALASFIRVGPQRASGVRVVSMRVGCCFDPRKATVEL